jgi:hypothetical protein
MVLLSNSLASWNCFPCSRDGLGAPSWVKNMLRQEANYAGVVCFFDITISKLGI